MGEPKKSIKELVAERIAGSGGVRISRVVDILAEQVLDKQVEQLKKGLELKDEAEKALSTIKPDKQLHPETGAVLQEFFTPQKLGEKRKAQEKLDRITKALNLAIDDGNFEQLSNLVKGGGQPSE